MRRSPANQKRWIQFPPIKNGGYKRSKEPGAIYRWALDASCIANVRRIVHAGAEYPGVVGRIARA